MSKKWGKRKISKQKNNVEIAEPPNKTKMQAFRNGAEDEIRTRDLLVGNEML